MRLALPTPARSADAPTARHLPARLRWDWPASVAVVWVLTGLGLVVSAYMTTRGTVYPIYATASRAWWAGAAMYGDTGANDLYRYSPTFAVLVSPFTLLPPGVGNAAWKLANVAVFAAGLWAWGHRVLPWSATRSQIAGLFFVALVAALGSYFNGQANLLMTGFVLLALAAITGQRWWLAAGLLAAATLIKVFPLALALTLCVVYRWKLPVRFAVVLLAGFALPVAAQNPGYALNQLGEWLRHLTATNEHPRAGHRSLDVLLELVGVGVDRRTFQALAVAAGGAVLAVAVTAARRGNQREALTTTAGWFLTWALLFGPSAENSTYSILAPVVAWAVVSAFERPGARFERVWLLACVYLMGLSTSDAGGPYRRFFEARHATTIGAVLFQVWLIADLFRRPAVTLRRAA